MGVVALPQAFALDAVATEEECEILRSYADTFGQPGEGYDGDEHYLGAGESFTGLLIVPVTQGSAPIPARLSTIAIIERMRMRLAEYFKVEGLRCGTASIAKRKGVAGVERGALSHPWHRDHDNRGSEDQWRRYTAVLHLNTDFEGGEVAFAGDLEQGEAFTCDPKVGRMIGFDGHQLHGVMRIGEGVRYTLVAWFGFHGEGHPPLPLGHVQVDG